MSIRDQYPQEYRLYGLSSLAVAVAFPRIKTLLQNWDMLTFPTLHSKVFESWRHLLKGEEVEGDGIPGESRSAGILVHTCITLCAVLFKVKLGGGGGSEQTAQTFVHRFASSLFLKWK